MKPYLCGMKKEIVKVTPFVGVWIETRLMLPIFLFLKSHPSWVCGLKLYLCAMKTEIVKSHPSWVCGLKQNGGEPEIKAIGVTPFVGVWIETDSSHGNF